MIATFLSWPTEYLDIYLQFGVKLRVNKKGKEAFTHMLLKDVKARSAKAGEKQYKLNDGGGLYLLVHPNGGKYWQFRYRFHGKEKVLSLGVYPEVSVADARDGRDVARKAVRNGKDPSAERRTAKRQALSNAENSFEAVASEWLTKQEAIWTRLHAIKVRKRLTMDIFPDLGSRPIAEILPIDLLAALRKVENRGAAYTAHRTQQIVGQIFRYAVASGRASRDITGDLRGALQPVKKQNFSRLSANELPEFLTKLNAYDGTRQTRIAVKLLLLTFVRTSELRGATWKEVDFSNSEWRIPAERMKMRTEHIVPLSRQAVALLRVQQQTTGDCEFVFPNRNRPLTFISQNTIIFAIYRLGYHSRATGHGFRGTASTILHERGFNTEVIERQLAHRDRNTVRASYNHAAHLPARRELMQWWGDYVEKGGMLCDESTL